MVMGTNSFMSERSLVRIPMPHTRLVILHIYLWEKIYLLTFEKTKNTQRRGQGRPIFVLAPNFSAEHIFTEMYFKVGLRQK